MEMYFGFNVSFIGLYGISSDILSNDAGSTKHGPQFSIFRDRKEKLQGVNIIIASLGICI